MTDKLNDLAEALLTAAHKAGADAADVIAVETRELDVNVRQGALEGAERSESLDFGLRVLMGPRQAVVSASDASADRVREMAERAVDMARQAPEDPFVGLAPSDALAGAVDIAALELADPASPPEPAELQADAAEAEAAALSHAGISQAEHAGASYSARDIFLAASNGFRGGYRRTSRSIGCVAIAGTGLEMERDYDADARVFQSDLRSAAEIGHSAATRALERQGSRKPPTGAFPVVYDERISSGLIGHLLVAANGSTVARGSSWLRDRLGERVLPAGMDLREDPLRPRATASRPFDAEGLPTRARMIVEDGVLTGWTLDLGTARKLGMVSTANAGRGVSSGPTPATWNVALSQGERSRDDLLREMGRGLLVTSLIGSTINPTTGDYSRGAAGFWVEGGEIAYPVNECTIAGNLHDMLATIVPANDARPWLSRVVPSLLVEGLTLAGG
jgi:PmbA protein